MMNTCSLLLAIVVMASSINADRINGVVIKLVNAKQSSTLPGFPASHAIDKKMCDTSTTSRTAPSSDPNKEHWLTADLDYPATVKQVKLYAITSNNKTKGAFSPRGGCGVIKVTLYKGDELIGRCEDHYGQGVWCDLSCDKLKVKADKIKMSYKVTNCNQFKWCKMENCVNAMLVIADVRVVDDRPPRVKTETHGQIDGAGNEWCRQINTEIRGYSTGVIFEKILRVNQIDTNYRNIQVAQKECLRLGRKGKNRCTGITQEKWYKKTTQCCCGPRTGWHRGRFTLRKGKLPGRVKKGLVTWTLGACPSFSMQGSLVLGGGNITLGQPPSL